MLGIVRAGEKKGGRTVKKRDNRDVIVGIRMSKEERETIRQKCLKLPHQPTVSEWVRQVLLKEARS